MFNQTYSSECISNDSSLKIKEEQFNNEHNLSSIFRREIGRDKIVISVNDTGVGLNKKDKF